MALVDLDIIQLCIFAKNKLFAIKLAASFLYNRIFTYD